MPVGEMIPAIAMIVLAISAVAVVAAQTRVSGSAWTRATLFMKDLNLPRSPEPHRKEAARASRDAALSRDGRPVKGDGPKNIVASVQARLVQRSRELGVEHQLTLGFHWHGYLPHAATTLIRPVF